MWWVGTKVVVGAATVTGVGPSTVVSRIPSVDISDRGLSGVLSVTGSSPATAGPAATRTLTIAKYLTLLIDESCVEAEMWASSVIDVVSEKVWTKVIEAADIAENKAYGSADIALHKVG